MKEKKNEPREFSSALEKKKKICHSAIFSITLHSITKLLNIEITVKI